MSINTLRILLLEDRHEDAELVERVLRKSEMPFLFRRASSKVEFFENLKAFKPDVVLSDHTMPSYNGFKACEDMRASGMDIPFILVTGSLADSVADEIAMAGVDDFLLKDRLSRLPQAIINAINRWQAEKERKVYFEKLSQNERRYRALIEQSHDSISLMDANLRVMYRSPSGSKITGWSDEELIENGILSLIHPDDVNIVRLTMAQIMASSGVATRIRYRVRHKLGHYVWMEGTVTNLLNDPDVGALVANLRDITERKSAETELERSEKKFRALIENISDGILLIDSAGLVTYQSPSVERITGYQLNDIHQQSIFEFFHPDDIRNAVAFFGRVMGTPGVPMQRSYRVAHKNGGYIWVEGTITNLLEDPDVGAFILNYRDISERKRDEERIRRTEGLLSEAQYLARIGNWNLDLGTQQLFLSEGLREIHGVAPDHPVDFDHFLSWIHPEDRMEISELLRQIMDRAQNAERIHRIVRQDTGEVRFLRGVTNADLDELGNTKRIFGTLQDITELRNAQDERDRTLRELENRVEERTRELLIKNKNITDSINYALQLQNALFPDPNELRRHFPESFIFHRPRNIVGGDFYWFYRRKNRVTVVCVDCTGHGVPGAFMSIVGINLLSRIVRDQNCTHPSRALQLLDEGIHRSIGMSKQDGVTDGMDIAFCTIDMDVNKIYFAGAMNSIMLGTSEGLVRYRGDRYGIGGYRKVNNKPFDTREIDYSPGDMLYLFSDGYPDQFGGDNGKRLKQTGFAGLIRRIQFRPVDEQVEHIAAYFDEWKGLHEQTDDVLVMGLRLDSTSAVDHGQTGLF